MPLFDLPEVYASGDGNGSHVVIREFIRFHGRVFRELLLLDEWRMSHHIQEIALFATRLAIEAGVGGCLGCSVFGIEGPLLRFRRRQITGPGRPLGGSGDPPPQDGALMASEPMTAVLWPPVSRPAAGTIPAGLLSGGVSLNITCLGVVGGLTIGFGDRVSIPAHAESPTVHDRTCDPGRTERPGRKGWGVNDLAVIESRVSPLLNWLSEGHPCAASRMEFKAGYVQI